MVSQNLNFWSISRKESLQTYQKYGLRNRILRALLCSNYIFNLKYNRESLIRRRAAILHKIGFNYKELIHPVQCTACKTCQTETLSLPTATGILPISGQFQYLWCTKCFRNTKVNNTKKINLFLHSFSLIFIYFGKVLLLWSQFFQCLAGVAFQLQSK